MAKPHLGETSYGILALKTLTSGMDTQGDLPLELLDKIWRYARGQDLNVFPSLECPLNEAFSYSRFFEPVVDFLIEPNNTTFPSTRDSKGRLIVMLMSGRTLYEATMDPFGLVPITVGASQIEMPEFGAIVCGKTGDFYGIGRTGLLRWRKGTSEGFQLFHDGLNVFHREVKLAGSYVVCGGDTLVTILVLDRPGGSICEPPITLSLTDRLTAWTAYDVAGKLCIVWASGEELRVIEMSNEECVRKVLVKADWVRNIRKDMQICQDTLLVGLGLGSETLCIALFDLNAGFVTDVISPPVGLNSFRVAEGRLYMHERASPFGGRILWKHLTFGRVSALKVGRRWRVPDVGKVLIGAALRSRQGNLPLRSST
ncbi:hypothetical protein FOL47_000885 [Perkinsus chesapeaki]|uniref:Uncharacterized protein n=1 Tax=Perkinsus chesapeaki TaxID=330153 RepID=A0A7J6MKU9_PERCH|nr:hypothetical protein FOL47_000885 [Perkinsus chesapeaki]